MVLILSVAVVRMVSSGKNGLAGISPQGDPGLRRLYPSMDLPRRLWALMVSTFFLVLARLARPLVWVAALGKIRSRPGLLRRVTPALSFPLQAVTAWRNSPVAACRPDKAQAGDMAGAKIWFLTVVITGDRSCARSAIRSNSGVMVSLIVIVSMSANQIEAVVVQQVGERQRRDAHRAVFTLQRAG